MISRSHGGLLAGLDRRRVQQLLGALLLPSSTDVRYLRWQPSGDLAYHEALVRFDASAEDYQSFVARRGLTPFSESGPNVHLPIDWTPPVAIDRPDWWVPSSNTPADAASGKVGSHGSIAVKWEDGRVYAVIVDTGERQPASGGGP